MSSKPGKPDLSFSGTTDHLPESFATRFHSCVPEEQQTNDCIVSDVPYWGLSWMPAELLGFDKIANW